MVGVMVASTLVFAACGDDDDAATEGTGTTASAATESTGTTASAATEQTGTTASAATEQTGTTASAATGGTGGQASGEPIVIGMINQEDTPAGSFPEIRIAVQSAVEYVNQELGGVDGRPLQVETCTTVGTPESSQTCANELVEKGVVLVTSGIDFGSAASLPILEQNDLLYVGGVPLLTPELTAPNSYMFIGGSVGAFPGQSVYLGENLGAKMVNIIYTDNDAGLAAATTFGKDVLEQVGVEEVNLIPEKADATDFTASVSSAANGNPDAVMVLFTAAGCGNIMKARASLGISDDIKFFYPGSCSDQAVIEAGGAGAEDAFFNEEFILFNDKEDEQVRIYRDKLEQYGEGEPKYSGFSQTGFSAIMNLKDIFEAVGVDDLNTASIRSFLDGTQEQANFMSHPYTCDGKQVPGIRAVCNANVRIVQYVDGEFTDQLGEWVTGADRLGGG